MSMQFVRYCPIYHFTKAEVANMPSQPYTPPTPPAPAADQWVYTEDQLPTQEDADYGGGFLHATTDRGIVTVENWAAICRYPATFPAWARRHPQPAPAPKRPKWRDATPEDAIRGYVDARFRDSQTNQWVEGKLIGYIAHGTPFRYRRETGNTTTGEGFVYCQVRAD